MRAVLVTPIVVASLGLLAACTTTAPIADASETPEPTVTAEESCAELSDVGTVIFNWESAQREGRLIGSEYEGGMRLAARMLHRVPVEEGTALADAVHAAQGLTPVGPAGARVDIIVPASDEWQAAWTEIAGACNAALEGSGREFGVEGWVGG